MIALLVSLRVRFPNSSHEIIINVSKRTANGIIISLIHSAAVTVRANSESITVSTMAQGRKFSDIKQSNLEISYGRFRTRRTMELDSDDS